MILDILQHHTSIISDYEIIKFRIVGESYQLIARIDLKDGSILFMKDYLFLDGSRKYAFHWQAANGDCLIRWDNAPHYQNIPTFPYHQHIGIETIIEPSPPMNLDKVLSIISTRIEDMLANMTNY